MAAVHGLRFLCISEAKMLTRSLCTNAAGATSLFVHLTGHIAGPQQVVLPIKCGERLGRGVDPRTQEQATLETLDRQGGRSQ